MGKGGRRALVIAGPTASGKSGLALEIAEAFGGVVINADSMQVYRELPILTAQPGPDALARAPHRLYGFLPARDACSAARWRDLALAEIGQARAAGRLPILVGGSGLYLRTLLSGISELPEIPAEIRAEARGLVGEIGPAALHARLMSLDPETAARIPPTDSQRLARAYEVLRATGRGLAAWQREAPANPAGLEAETILLTPPRDELYASCDRRLEEMVRAGALAEIATLAAARLDPDLPAMKALGLRELLAHVEGGQPLHQAIAAAQQATRRYAKRQTTWFRHQMHANHVLKDSESFRSDIFSIIRQILLTTPL